MLGANTYRAMAGFAPAAADNPNFAALNAASKVVMSHTLQEPLALENTTLIAEDARDAVPRLKAESPCRCAVTEASR